LFIKSHPITIWIILVQFSSVLEFTLLTLENRTDGSRRIRYVPPMHYVLTEAIRALILVPPPVAIMGPIEICLRIPMLLNVLHQFMCLITSLAPPSVAELTLRDRLFYDFHGHNFNGRDLFTLICQQRYLFWLNTGETPETFLDIVYRAAPRFFTITRCGNQRQRVKRFKLNIVNRVLLVFIWLRKYSHIDTPALIFDINPQTVSALLY